METVKKTIVSLLLCALFLLSTVALAESNWVCPNCGTENNMNFCTNCGTAKPKEVTCPRCASVFPLEYKFNYCPYCGTSLKDTRLNPREIQIEEPTLTKEEWLIQLAKEAAEDMKNTPYADFLSTADGTAKIRKHFDSIVFDGLHETKPEVSVIVRLTKKQAQEFKYFMDTKESELGCAFGEVINSNFNMTYANVAASMEVYNQTYDNGKVELPKDGAYMVVLFYSNDIVAVYTDCASKTWSASFIFSEPDVAASVDKTFVNYYASVFGLTNLETSIIKTK